MADYWKSQAKKFCDLCKCWIADNKPSIGFHESGKRHKENVTKKLADITKNSLKKFKEELQEDKEMKKMEEDALKAYMKDLQENPDYTSKRILEETEKRKKELEESVRKNEEQKTESVKLDETQTILEPSTSKVWNEAKSEEGYTYYWNINTAESIWEPPKEGFVSIEEQEIQQKETKLKEEEKRMKREEKNKQKHKELSALKERESMKKKRKKDEEKRGEDSNCVGPVPKPDPYGAWTVIEPKVEEPLDLELPEQEYIAIKVPELKEPEIKFKEKTYSSLQDEKCKLEDIKQEDEGYSAGFKKRKLNRGNMRQKLDTD